MLVEFGRQFSIYSLFYFYPMVLYMTIRQWFQALQIVYPATIVSALSVGTNVLFNQLFIFGIPGEIWS